MRTRSVRSANDGGRRPLSVSLLVAALFTLSWDRLAAIPVGGFNLKVCYVLFALALVADAIDVAVGRAERSVKTSMRFAPLLGGVLILLTLPAVWAVDSTAVVLRAGVVLVGAILPAIATSLIVRRHRCFDRALTAVIVGAYVASVFAIYQVFAFYAGLPQGITYTGLAGGYARATGFSYEPGYFGYFLILAMAAILSRARYRNESAGLWGLSLLAVTLVISNSRASFLLVPALGLLLLLAPLSRRAVGRLVAAAAVGGVVATGAVLAVPSLWTSMTAKAATLFDPNEQTSNAPRLERLRFAAEVFREHQWGIGSDNLYVYLPIDVRLTVEGAANNDFVTNNIWMQAALDGGWPLLAMHLVLVAVLIRVALTRRSAPGYPLLAGVIAVVLVSGLIVSLFYDVKLWALAALALSLARDRVAVRPDARDLESAALVPKGRSPQH